MAERAPSGEGERRKGKEPDDPKPEREAKADKAEKPEKNGPARSVPPPAPESKTASKSVAAPAAHEQHEPHPSIPPLPAAGPWRSYKEIVASIATRIVEAQRPIRVLQAIRWDGSIEEQFRKSRYRELPKVDADYYAKQELGFDPKAEVGGVRGDRPRHRSRARRVGRDRRDPHAAPRSSIATSCACSRRAARRCSTPTRGSSTARRRTSSPTARRRSAISGTCSTRSSRTSTTTLLGMKYERNIDGGRRRRGAERALR